MFPVQLPGEGAGCSGEWGEARDEAWHLMSISFKFWKLLAKKFLFVANDWHVNQQENQQDHDGNPPALRSPAEACALHEGTFIQRIASVGIGAAGGEFFILLHISGSKSAGQQTANHNAGADDDGGRRRLCYPEIDDGKHKTYWHADSACDCRPARHAGSARADGQLSRLVRE